VKFLIDFILHKLSCLEIVLDQNVCLVEESYRYFFTKYSPIDLDELIVAQFPARTGAEGTRRRKNLR